MGGWFVLGGGDPSSAGGGGRVVMSHEGGYSPVYVPFCGLAVLEAMSGQHVLDDPFLPLVSGFAGHELKPAEADVAAPAAKNLPPARARA
jgi:hypothetical protein